MKAQTLRRGPAALAAFAFLSVAGTAGATHQVTNFATHGFGVFDPLFYEADGIVFPAERCGSAGCDTWFVGHVQGFDALVGNTLLGPITGTFTAPVSSLSVRVAPAGQGTVEYTLSAFASGPAIASTSVIVTQDSGDPEHGGFGYVTIDLGSLPELATSFTLDNRVVRSSFGFDRIEYGMSSIAFTPSHLPPSSCAEVRGDGRLATSSLTRFVLDKVRSDGVTAPSGRISFSDRGASPRLHFESTAIATLVVTGSHVRMTGTGIAGGVPVDFVAEGDDASSDSFSIRLSSGYSASGPVAAGRGVNVKRCDAPDTG